MIESIFLIKWDSIKRNAESKKNGNNIKNDSNGLKDKHKNNNNNNHNNFNNNSGIHAENSRVIEWYPQNNVILSNSITFNRIIRAHLEEIQFFTHEKVNNGDKTSSYDTDTGVLEASKEPNIGKKRNEKKQQSRTEEGNEVEQIFYEKISGISTGISPDINLDDFYSKQEYPVKSSKKPNLKPNKGIITQNIFDYGILSYYISPNKIICLVFDKEYNPEDYINKFEEALDTFIMPDRKDFDMFCRNNEQSYEIELVLASIFMDIRSDNLLMMEEENFFIDEDESQETQKDKIIKVFIYGIDNAGKSSLMRYLKTGKYDHNYFAPTKKFIIHKIPLPKEKIKLICWEMPGQKSFRRVWLRGVQDSNLVVFMLDAADRERYAESRRAFWSIMTRHEIKNVPVLFIANKIDLVDNGHELAQIESYFSLSELKEREWATKFISLVTLEGIKETLDWVGNAINGIH